MQVFLNGLIASLVSNGTNCKSCLVHDEGVALLEVGDALVGKVQHTAGRADQDVHHVVKTHDVVLQGRASGRDLSNGHKNTAVTRQRS